MVILSETLREVVMRAVEQIGGWSLWYANEALQTDLELLKPAGYE